MIVASGSALRCCRKGSDLINKVVMHMHYCFFDTDLERWHNVWGHNVCIAVIFQVSSGKKSVTGRRKRLESDASVQSLPADLERVVSICENELSGQASTKPGFRASIDSTLSSGSDEAFLGVNTSGTPNVDAAQTSGTDGDVSCSSRESLYDGGDSQKMHGEHQKVLPGGGIDLQRFVMHQRTRAASSDTAEQRNRTMLIQVGENELTLISLDRKTVIFERHFKDISFCSQVI